MSSLTKVGVLKDFECIAYFVKEAYGDLGKRGIEQDTLITAITISFRRLCPL